MKNQLTSLFIKASLLLAIGLGFYLHQEDLTFNWDPKSFFDQQSSTYSEYQGFVETFGSDKDNIIVYKPKTGHVLDLENLRKLQALIDQINAAQSQNEFAVLRSVGSLLSEHCLKDENSQIDWDKVACLKDSSIYLKSKGGEDYGLIILKTNFRIT